MEQSNKEITKTQKNKTALIIKVVLAVLLLASSAYLEK